MQVNDIVVYSATVCKVLWVDDLPTGDIAIETSSGMVLEVKQDMVKSANGFKAVVADELGRIPTRKELTEAFDRRRYNNVPAK